MTSAATRHLAQQGDPDAIATLMNRTLQPRGIIANAEVGPDHLHIFFTSSRPLHPPALISFTQHGLAKLGIEMFPIVRVSAYQPGEDLPLWIEEISQVGTGDGLPGPPAGERRGKPSGPIPMLPRRSRLWRWAVALVCVSFVTGGLIAWFAHDRGLQAVRFGRPRPTGLQSPIAAVPLVVPSPNAQLLAQQAQAYLVQMNRVQQTFYAQNGRFAANLEELERSASIMARSDSYRYTLTVQAPEQADLTAIPQFEGGVSFRAIAAIADTLADPVQPLTAICASDLPSKMPPAPPQIVGLRVQCPPNSSLVTPP